MDAACTGGCGSACAEGSGAVDSVGASPAFAAGRSFAPDPAGDIAYLCGNPDMVDASFEALKGYGLPIPQIRREKYVSNK